MQLAHEQGLLQTPSEWAMAGLQPMFEGLWEATGMAHLRAGVHSRSMMREAATVTA